MPEDSPVNLQTARLCLTMPPPSAVDDVLAFYKGNQQHTERWDPPRPHGFLTRRFWHQRLDVNRRELTDERSLRLFLFHRADEAIVGICNFTNVIRGPLQACTLGYTIDRRYEGQGFMFEALEVAVPFAFERLRLHRIQASYVPANERSGRLLERLGFEKEGVARKYLYINGAWSDHIQTARINPNPLPPPIAGPGST